MTLDPRPVGIFDSGIGGLTVARALLSAYPAERVIYVADQAHVPYGGRDLLEVRGFASAISGALAARGCRAIVMACNISSAVARDAVASQLAPIPVIGVISSAARVALAGSVGAPRIGVLATEGTVLSGAYSRALRAACPSAQVVEQPCPELVPMIEAGSVDSREGRSACRAYMNRLIDEECSVAILGCTHYPLALTVLEEETREAGGRWIRFVDPSAAVVQDLARLAALNPGLEPASFEAWTTGDTGDFGKQLQSVLPGMCTRVQQALWHDGRLELVPSGA